MKRFLGIALSTVFLFSACNTKANSATTDSGNNTENPGGSEKRFCEVTFKNYNASILYYSSVEYGGTAVYQGDTPTRPADSSYRYTFKGWDKPLNNITQDTVFIAQYNQRESIFEVNWVIDDETITEEYHYGEMPSFKNGIPQKEPDLNYTYTFSEWYPFIRAVSSDQTYRAVFTQKPAKVLVDNDSDAWLLLGGNILADGSINDWSIPKEEEISKKQLTPIKLANVKTIDEALFKTLLTKKIKYLYKYENAQFGTRDAGWSRKVLVNGNIYQANGSYAFIAAKIMDYDYVDDFYCGRQEYIPTPQTNYEPGTIAESLTPETLYAPLWSEVSQYNLMDNPAVLKSGVFTIIIAEYEKEELEETPAYGIAAVLTEAKEGIEIIPAAS